MNELIERDAVLQTLHERMRLAATAGHVTWVAGEAGVGKTSVLRRLAAGQPAGAVWWGACDALQTPHPLAPLYDIGRDAGTRFAAAVAGPRATLFEAVLDELRFAAQPILVVIEDAHWADDATLDFIKFLGRRIERTRALLAVSFRDDEVSASHPLRSVIGELPTELMTRIDLPRLSPTAVEELARTASRSPHGLYAVTHGNPFFVTELLRHREDEMPRSIQDLVLARFARLSKPAQAIVRLTSIVPGRIERWLAEALLAPSLADLEACLDSGLLLADASSLSFRHELARVAVAGSLAPLLAQSLHAQALAAIVASGRALTPARLVHHAALAGDEGAVRRYAPAAAQNARERGAHREAARHWRTALQQADPIDEDERCRWLEAYALVCRNIAWNDEAITARQELDVSYRRSGDVVAQALNLSRLAGPYVSSLRDVQAAAVSRQAIELLERLPPSAALAAAYGVEAWLRMLFRDCAESVDWSHKAIALAHTFGDRQQLCASLGTLGTALMFVDYDRGCRQMEEALQMARDEALPAVEGTTMLNLGSGSGELMRFAAAERWLRESIAYATEFELDNMLHYAQAWLALCELHTGNWAGAAERASDVVARVGAATISRAAALLALGRLRLRRGDPGVDAALDEALALAGPSQTLQRIAPVRAARAEAAFARGDSAATVAEAEAALPLALRQQHPWFIGELAFWCWRAGALEAAPAGCAEPYALQIAGRWREAAAAWEALSCPYERARALADGDGDAQQAALAQFERLGARPAVEALRRRLHESGVRGLARGARASTRERAYGLTTRELQVLRLLCDGLRNAEIAKRLSRSVRTVDHHLAAVFAKLGVDSRVAAIQAAQHAGLATQSGQEAAPK